MTGGRCAAVGYLTLNPKVGIGVLDVLTKVVDQVADTPRLKRGFGTWFEVRGSRFQGLGTHSLA